MLNKKLVFTILASLSLGTSYLYSYENKVTNKSKPGMPSIYVDFFVPGDRSHIDGSIAPGATKQLSSTSCYTEATAQVRHTDTSVTLKMPNECGNKELEVKLDDNKKLSINLVGQEPATTTLSDKEYEKAMRCIGVPDGGQCLSEEAAARFIAAGQQIFANAQKK